MLEKNSLYHIIMQNDAICKYIYENSIIFIFKGSKKEAGGGSEFSIIRGFARKDAKNAK